MWVRERESVCVHMLLNDAWKGAGGRERERNTTGTKPPLLLIPDTVPELVTVALKADA